MRGSSGEERWRGVVVEVVVVVRRVCERVKKGVRRKGEKRVGERE